MSIHKEISFEVEICQHLAANGWLYAEGDAAGYDRARALFPADVLAWVQATQPKAWEVLTKNHGTKAADALFSRLRDQPRDPHPLLKDMGKHTLVLQAGETPKLDPLTETGGGMVREKQSAYLAELIEKVNSLFDGGLTDDDKLVYVNNVIKGKLLESELVVTFHAPKMAVMRLNG